MTDTEVEETLIIGLKSFQMEVDEAIGIMLMLKDKREQQEELILWMHNNQKATPSDILGRAMKIAGKTKE